MISRVRLFVISGLLGLALAVPAAGEAMLQYFNTSWAEITRKMPELAEAGYDSLWLPPPTKGSGGLSVGYDCWDRFDLGSKDQRGSVRTRYGTEAELLELVRVAHRFGIRIYFDNVMNHNAFDIPGFNASTPIDLYPGFLPEDFHLRKTEDGFYRKWDNTRSWSDAWQVQNLGLSDLIDIATEPGTTNFNHGPTEGSTMRKIDFVRHPNQPEYYCYLPTASGQKHSAGQGTYVGFGPANGITTGVIAANPSFYSERVEDLLHRAARWQIDRTRADGLRLDAVKHTPADFYGATYGADKDSSSYGYTGQVQVQFNLSRGFSDWSNHRDSLFNTEQGRDDAMLFGEHLGQPPAYGPYIDAGMRLIDNDLRSNFNNLLGNPSSGLTGYDAPGFGGFPASVSVPHAQSHDNDFAGRRELQHAFYFTRAGLPLIYTDGNYHAETLGESGGAFPRHANTAFLGQWGDARIPNLLRVHQDFARGWQRGRWSGSDLVSYERIDDRSFSESNQSLKERKGVTMLIAVNDNYSSGVSIQGGTSFPSQAGGGSENNPNTNDEYLFQYARGYGSQTGFYTYASSLSGVTVDKGSYFVFAPRTPEESDLWKSAGGEPITLLQNGQQVPTVNVVRRDGPDGDPAFNPNGVADPNNSDFAYTVAVPRVTSATSLKFVARVDGSAENVLLRLDGGIDLNGTRPPGNVDPLFRDNPPAVSNDSFLGYEQPNFVRRQQVEKFAARDTSRNQFGSTGAETYTKTIGSGSFTVVNGPTGSNNFSNDGGNQASFLYHDPAQAVGGTPGGGWPGGNVPQQFVENASTISIWAKPNGVGLGFKMFCYYTTDGTNPEGAGGTGTGTTKVSEMAFSHNQDSNDWWMTSNIPKPASGSVFKYKVGILKEGSSSVYPSGPDSVFRKKRMMTVFETPTINPSTLSYSAHNDYNSTTTGLQEGFHIIRGRAFLKRDGKSPLYNTFSRTFYYDAATPGGQIVFPGSDGEQIGGSEYGAVVRADNSVQEVWYRVTDGEGSNDDSATGTSNGNGAWVKATEITPTVAITPTNPAHGREWRFNYVNIPATGSATLEVRLKELSSSDDMNLTDVAGHFTTLTRTIQTRGPDLRLFVAYPQAEGDVIDDSYVLKVYFSKSLADGTTEATLKQRFTVRYGANEGWSAGIQVLDRAAFSINYNETSDYHALAFRVPNLFNGSDDFLHRIEVTYDRADPLSDLVATRRVRAAPSTLPRVTILQPQEFDSNGKLVEIILPDGPGADTLPYTVRVETSANATSVALGFELGSGTLTPVDADPVAIGIQPTYQGSSAFWDFIWTINAPGTFRLVASAAGPGGNAADKRNATVIRRQRVAGNPSDLDDDDDGLSDFDEGTITPLPNGFPTDDVRYKANSEQWTNGDIHVHFAYGKSDPLLPDSDGDGLPDGLEVGWRTPFSATNTATDTNGDSFPNFIGDLDPPFFNTLDNLGSVPGVNSASEGGDRTKRLRGSTTDPGNPDSDGDGILDGVEDSNRNGWVDGDGASLGTTTAATTGRNWPNGEIDVGEVWLETHPGNPDTDGDGLSDGSGEDKDLNGVITGDSNADRVWQSGEVWTETNPLKGDTDGDGLPDGWETGFGLNALDNGTVAFDGSTSNPNNGAAGDPDQDGLTNLQELVAGTDPRVDNTVPPFAGEKINIGPVSEADSIVRGAVTNRQEFTDWKISDLVVLDEFEGDGSGNQGGDTYLGNDGFDSSRDIVAFYARDGGDPVAGGTDELYFRVDFQDLQPFAEEGNLDLYVLIDTGNPTIGEYALPDEVDTGTQMKWEAVVAVYKSNDGAVFVDTNPANNTTGINQDLTSKGVQRRAAGSLNGFKKAYFDSKQDAVEFSISRQALRDAGWLGDPASLSFQVFTTRDGTKNSPQGAGDLGGRSDIRDTIYDDWLAEDYWRDQGYISQNSELRTWFSYNGPDRGKRAKVMSVIHGNEPILPGSQIQLRLNNGAGAGYYRPFDVHDAYSSKLGLHVTPTLASSLQWASVDPAASKPWRDGPAFNQRIGQLASDGVVELISSTYADSPLPYFSQAAINDSIGLSNTLLQGIYGVAPSSRVLWVPERVIDEGVLAKVSAAGFSHVFIDQFRHLSGQFGRSSALLDDGYRINQINGVKAMVINDRASEFRFRNTDSGLDINLRQLLSRKARSGEQHQMLILSSDLSDFRTKASADAYDANIAWLASRPWIELVGPDQVAAGQVDLSVPPNGTADTFAPVNRGSSVVFTRKQAPLWLDHATQGTYDHWWFGSAQEESLRDKVFNIRPGVPINRGGGADNFYGVQQFGPGGVGITRDAWNSVSSIGNTPLGRLARGTYHASQFLAGWHDEDNGDLSTFSTGDFINADTTFDTLAASSRIAQSQSRFAAVYQGVQTWATSPPATAQANALDVDLDGESEFVLSNSRVYAVFEAIGGRCVAAWARDVSNGQVRQVIGNLLSFSGTETEFEGSTNHGANGSVGAYRTSAFKDWWAGSTGGADTFVNALYTVAPASSGTGWQFTNPAGTIVKTIRLETGSDSLVASYQLSGAVSKLFVRFGLSPDLDDLLVSGQAHLTTPALTGSTVSLSNRSPLATTTAAVQAVSGVTWQSLATDDEVAAFDTLRLRNQAQTQQIEMESQASSFVIGLSLSTTVLDGDQDGLPADWETANGLDDNNPNGANGPEGDPDGDGVSNLIEWLVGMNPQLADRSSYPKLGIASINGGVRLTFATLPGRSYQLQSSLNLGTWSPFGTPTITPANAAPGLLQIDDTSGLPKRFYRMVISPVP